MHLHEFLKSLHDVVRPRTYLEVGVQRGESLTFSRVPSVGIDPEFGVVSELFTDVHLARTTSDEFFARTNPLAHLRKKVIDLAFIDGMHLAEYALRDYLAVERFTSPGSVVVIDDMLPRSVEEASRHRRSVAWTGDVFKAGVALREQRPDLVLIEVDTQPTGVMVVLAPDASRGGVLPGYDDWLDTACAPDPQDVPGEILTRSRALDPQRVLDSPGWAHLRRLRRSKTADPAAVRTAFADLLGARAA